MFQFGKGTYFLVKDEFLDGHQRICNIGQTDIRAAGGVVERTSLGDVESLFRWLPVMRALRSGSASVAGMHISKEVVQLDMPDL